VTRNPLVAVAAPLLCHAAVAQVADPVPGPIPVGNAKVRVELVAQLPDSGPGGSPRARPMTLVGDGSGRRFVADQNGLVLQLHPAGSNVPGEAAIAARR